MKGTMKLDVRRAYVLYAVVASAAGAVVSTAAGCGDDNSVTSGEDSGSDSTAEGGGDVQATETGPDADAGTMDSADAPATEDVSDAPSGFVDVGDVAIDVPPLGQFPHAVDLAYCTRLQQCCMVPSSQWDNTNDQNGCVPTLDTYGGVVGIADFNSALDSGLVLYDASAAKTCLDYVYSFTCGTVPASAITFIRDQCFGAMQGTLTAGNGPCVNSLQCTSGLYCQLTADGGPGNCTALKTQGQPCVDTTLSTDCTYLGNGTPALYCFDPMDGGAPTCQPALPLDASTCTGNAACQTWTCNYPTCVDTVVFSDPGTPMGICATFTIVDAGGGG
jgi:hypothetical protein